MINNRKILLMCLVLISPLVNAKEEVIQPKKSTNVLSTKIAGVIAKELNTELDKFLTKTVVLIVYDDKGEYIFQNLKEYMNVVDYSDKNIYSKENFNIHLPSILASGPENIIIKVSGQLKYEYLYTTYISKIEEYLAKTRRAGSPIRYYLRSPLKDKYKDFNVGY